MIKRRLSNGSIALIKYLLSDERISDKVLDNAKDKAKYKSISIREDGVIVLGKTSSHWWNQLIACQDKIPFNDFALKVWDALVNLSSGMNNVALEKGLSTEIANLSQREGDYDGLVHRLVDCYEHVCNNKGNQSLEGDPGKSGLNGAFAAPTQVPNDIVININGVKKKVVPFKDSAGDKWIDVAFGVTDVNIR